MILIPSVVEASKAFVHLESGQPYACGFRLLYQDVMDTAQEVQRLGNALEAARIELARLRPEPKFRVGQVVWADERGMWGRPRIYKIAEIALWEGVYKYWSAKLPNPDRYYYSEADLRALTDEEK